MGFLRWGLRLGELFYGVLKLRAGSFELGSELRVGVLSWGLGFGLGTRFRGSCLRCFEAQSGEL